MPQISFGQSQCKNRPTGIKKTCFSKRCEKSTFKIYILFETFFLEKCVNLFCRVKQVAD